MLNVFFCAFLGVYLIEIADGQRPVIRRPDRSIGPKKRLFFVVRLYVKSNPHSKRRSSFLLLQKILMRLVIEFIQSSQQPIEKFVEGWWQIL
jgi:hypothetical protein